MGKKQQKLTDNQRKKKKSFLTSFSIEF